MWVTLGGRKFKGRRQACQAGKEQRRERVIYTQTQEIEEDESSEIRKEGIQQV